MSLITYIVALVSPAGVVTQLPGKFTSKQVKTIRNFKDQAHRTSFIALDNVIYPWFFVEHIQTAAP
jgi:hypothetical protein